MPASEMRSSRARRAALGDAGGRDLLDDRFAGRGQRLDAAGAGRVADRAEPHGRLERRLVVAGLDEPVDGEQHAVALDDLALVREVELGQVDLLVADVGPDVEFGPVGQREHPDVLALAVPPVVEVPQLRTLVARIPRAELVAEAEHALLGARLLLIATRAAEHRAELVLADAAQQGHRLQPVAGRVRPGVLDRTAGVDVVLHAGDDQAQPVLLDRLVAERDDLVEVLAGVDVHHRERHPSRPERLDREVQHHHRVLAAGEQQRRALDGGRDLAEDVHGLGLELFEVGELVGGRRHGGLS